MKKKVHCLRKAFQNQLSESFLFPLHSLMLQPGLKRVHGSLATQHRRDTLENKRKIVLRQAVAHVSHAAWVAREEHEVEKDGRRSPVGPCLSERRPSAHDMRNEFTPL
jgi:hypothetical protein